jgi:hypothetical protein
MSDVSEKKDGGVDAVAAVALITIVIVTAIFWITNQ